MEKISINGYTIEDFTVSKMSAGKTADGQKMIQFELTTGGSEGAVEIDEEAGIMRLNSSQSGVLYHFVFEGTKEFTYVQQNQQIVKDAIASKKLKITGARVSLEAPNAYNWKDASGEIVKDKAGNPRIARRITQFIHKDRLTGDIAEILYSRHKTRIKNKMVIEIIEDPTGDTGAVSGDDMFRD